MRYNPGCGWLILVAVVGIIVTPFACIYTLGESISNQAKYGVFTSDSNQAMREAYQKKHTYYVWDAEQKGTLNKSSDGITLVSDGGSLTFHVTAEKDGSYNLQILTAVESTADDLVAETKVNGTPIGYVKVSHYYTIDPNYTSKGMIWLHRGDNTIQLVTENSGTPITSIYVVPVNQN